MGIKLKRKLFKIGQSHAVTLPQAWVAFYGKRSDEVTIIGSDVLVIAPAGLEQRAEQVLKDIESYAEAVTGNTGQEEIES